MRRERNFLVCLNLFWFLIIASVNGLLLANSPNASAAVQTDNVSDNDILEAVELEFRSDDALTPDTIDVMVSEGVVSLSGESETLLAKRQAVRAVGSLKGVRGVANQIRVSASPISNDELLAEVQTALQVNEDMNHNEVSATVEANGIIKLSGSANSYVGRQLAENAVANVRGVTSIENQIRVIVDADRSPEEIKSEILRRFSLSPYIAEGLIDVNVGGRIAKLSGAVGSVNERVLAEILCWVSGIEKVDIAELSVDPSKTKDRRREKFTTLKNDVTLQDDVEDVLLYDPRVRSAGIRVSAKMAAVTLSGNVKTLAAKQAAGRDAFNTLGVRRVINNLKVKVNRWPGDLEVTKTATAALDRDAQLSSLDLTPSSHFGTLYVRGDVNTFTEYDRVTSLLANLKGVRDIVNRVNVDRQPTELLDEDILEDTNRRLRWSPFLNADEIAVSVNDGIATLRGNVDTWHDRRLAERSARQSGATKVKNLLKVRFSAESPNGVKATLSTNKAEYVINERLKIR